MPNQTHRTPVAPKIAPMKPPRAGEGKWKAGLRNIREGGMNDAAFNAINAGTSAIGRNARTRMIDELVWGYAATLAALVLIGAVIAKVV